jgi:chromate reductase
MLDQIRRIVQMENERDLRIVGISGSLRAGSFNTALLRAAQEVVPAGMEIELFDLQGLPIYDGDVEAAGDPASVTDLKNIIRDADGVLLATPEYNHGTSGALKNAIDWASRDRRHGSIAGKPFTVRGVGPSGAARAVQQLEPVLLETGSLLMAKPGVLVSMPWTKFDETGRLTDEDTRAFLRKHLEAFANWVARVRERALVEEPLAA